MADTVKEEEFGDDKGLDQHDEASCYDRQKGDYVHHTDGVEDDVAWTSQGFLEEGHFCVFSDASRDLENVGLML